MYNKKNNEKVFFFLLPTHMSQEEKNNGNIEKKLLSTFSRGKLKIRSHKNDQHFRFVFFFQQAKPTCSFFNVTAR